MAIPTSTISVDAPVESSSSAVSWAPVIAGAFVATVVTLVLTLVSPFPSESSSAGAISVYAAIWLVIVQWVSAGVGGYLTGRLRTKWVGVHTDEVFFRDTAHGFLTWAVATVVVVMFLSSAVSSIVGGATRTVTQAAAATTAAAADAASENMPDLSTSYFTDALLRPANPMTPPPAAAAGSNEAATAELSRILLRSAANGEFSATDRTYVEQLIAARTGLSEADAKARVDTVLKQIEDAKVATQEAADTARKSAATTALLGALSMLIGAFIASAAGALGGRRRDEDEAIFLAS